MLSNPNNKIQALDSFNLIRPLYTSVRLIRRSNDSTLQVSSILEKLENLNLAQFKTYLGLELNRTHSKLPLKPYLLDYILYGTNQEARPDYFDECSTWILADLQAEFSRYNYHTNIPSGLFYTSELSHSQLSSINAQIPELGSIRTSIENQLSVIR